MKASIWGMTLKAMRLVNFLRSTVLARAGDRLVGGDDDALDGGAVVQRLQRDDKLRRRAIGIGDDVLLAEALDRVGIDLGHDQRHLGIVAPGRGIVDDDAALRGDLR
jgi:hypothetical protein